MFIMNFESYKCMERMSNYSDVKNHIKYLADVIICFLRMFVQNK